MPNDRAAVPLLQNLDLKKYPSLAQFLTAQSLSSDKSTNLISNQQALDLLEDAINEVEQQRQPTSSAQSRQKELIRPADTAAPETQVDLAELENSQPETQAAPEKTPSTEQQASEKAPVAELIKSSEASEIRELGQELNEIKEVDREQENQELAKKQQSAIDQLAGQAQTAPSQVKPVVVLPITEKQKIEAKKKGLNFSLRWLAEWADKIRKIFSGAVLYKEEVENSTDV